MKITHYVSISALRGAKRRGIYLKQSKNIMMVENETFWVIFKQCAGWANSKAQVEASLRNCLGFLHHFFHFL